jgi:hypothetical protein
VPQLCLKINLSTAQICYEFNPELVIVSAGFDSGLGDPLGGCRITPQGYAHMTAMLSMFAGGRIALVMEGGYNLRTISRSFAACARVLRGQSPPPLPGSMRPSSAAHFACWQTQMAMAPTWSTLRTTGLMQAAPLGGMPDGGSSSDGDFNGGESDEEGDTPGLGTAAMLFGEDDSDDEDVDLDDDARTEEGQQQQQQQQEEEQERQQDSEDVDLDDADEQQQGGEEAIDAEQEEQAELVEGDEGQDAVAAAEDDPEFEEDAGAEATDEDLTVGDDAEASAADGHDGLEREVDVYPRQADGATLGEEEGEGEGEGEEGAYGLGDGTNQSAEGAEGAWDGDDDGPGEAEVYPDEGEEMEYDLGEEEAPGEDERGGAWAADDEQQGEGQGVPGHEHTDGAEEEPWGTEEAGEVE